MTTIQTKLASRKLTQETGVPDALASEMFHRGEGGHWVAIIDLGYLDRTEGLEGKKIVRLEATQLEVLTGQQADFARELMAAAYKTRQPQGFDDLDQGEDVDEITRRGRLALLYCPTCLHKRTDDTISHWAGDVDADGAECTWADTDERVTPAESIDDDQAGSQNATDNEAKTDDAPGPWPGDPNAGTTDPAPTGRRSRKKTTTV